MSEQAFAYGETSRRAFLEALAAAAVSALILRHLANRAEEANEGLVASLRGPGDWILAGVVVYGVVAALVLAIRTGLPDEGRKDRLAFSERGLDYRPRRLLFRHVFVAYHQIEKLELVDEESGIDLRIEHTCGSLRLHRNWFDDSDSFKEFAEMLAARSRKNVEGGYYP